PRYRAVRALAPLELIEQLATQPQVRSIRPADRAWSNGAGVSVEGDIAHRADVARNAFAVDGAGVKVGVLSDSVDYLARVENLGHLPAVTVLPGQAGHGNGEGTAMLEIVHYLAPGDLLYFANAFFGVAGFVLNIRARQAA